MTRNPERRHSHSRLFLANELFMVVLAIASGALLYLSEMRDLNPTQIEVIDLIDVVIGLIFFSEFVVRFFLSRERRRYLKLRWWELFAAIPIATPWAEALRLLRILRFIRVILHLRIAKEELNAFVEPIT